MPVTGVLIHLRRKSPQKKALKKMTSQEVTQRKGLEKEVPREEEVPWGDDFPGSRPAIKLPRGKVSTLNYSFPNFTRPVFSIQFIWSNVHFVITSLHRPTLTIYPEASY
jgi:hypothetical protein